MGERGGRRFRPPRPGSADAELDGRYLAWLRRAADDLSRRPPNAAGTAKSDAAQLAANAAAFREAYLAERREAYMRQHRPSAAAGAAASSSTAGANGAAQAGSYDDAADAFAAWSALNEAGYFEAHQNATAASGTAGTDASQAGPSPSAARPPDPTAVDGGYQGGGADGELRHRRR
ncbi:MAG: hypothetical protein M1832_004622 [Thelocarpon impressellum]|nr:MAG: hypothetical protein M1832_004622 [Thelocarpon impressellum]